MIKAALSFLCFLFLATSSQANAQHSDWHSSDYIQGRLLSGGVSDDLGYAAAIELRISDGWHAYWRMPGEGGLPPRFDWNGSDNIKSIEVLWPIPKRFETFGLYSFGYQDEILLPLSVSFEEDELPASIKLKADIMVCKDICVPQVLELNHALEHLKSKTDHSKRIDAVLKSLPKKENTSDLKIESSVIGPSAVVVNAYSKNGFENADLFIESGDIYVSALPEITIDKEDPRRAMIRVAAPEGIDNLAKSIEKQTVRITLVEGRSAVEKEISF